LQLFVILLGIVLNNPKGLILEARDKAEAIHQEYITMLRYRYTVLCSRETPPCSGRRSFQAGIHHPAVYYHLEAGVH
jgi:hypothetical protein